MVTYNENVQVIVYFDNVKIGLLEMINGANTLILAHWIVSCKSKL